MGSTSRSAAARPQASIVSSSYRELQLDAARRVGLGAQEAERLFPELVTEDARGYKAVRYHMLPLMLIQALKEQQEVIQQQQKDIGS